jgi:hypothetical protein
MAELIEFKNKQAYEAWLGENSDRVRIIAVSTNKKGSVWTGFLGDNKSYSVTYEALPAEGTSPE